MTDPAGIEQIETASDSSVAVFLRPVILTQRSDFIKASRARRLSTPGFNLQARARQPQEADGIRIGFTCSKKVGNAVARNRAKRRLREIARLILPHYGKTGFDYVLVGRPETTAARDFQTLQDDLSTALAKIHAGQRG